MAIKREWVLFESLYLFYFYMIEFSIEEIEEAVNIILI